MNDRFFPLVDDDASRALLAAAMFGFAGFFVIAPTVLFDERLFNGAPIWAKPLKFWLSTGIHFASLAILVQLLSAETRNRFAIRASAFLAVLAVVFENVYISVQAMRGRASHFNYETVFESIMYALMGVGALLLVFVAFVIGVALARQNDGERSGLKHGAVLGLITAPILTIAFGGFMSVHGSHYVGAPNASDAGGLPVFGWSTTAADMRPAHFFATHLIQIAPLAGWAGDHVSNSVGRTMALTATLVTTAIAIAMFTAALLGTPPLGFLATAR